MPPGPRWPAALQQVAWMFRPFAFLEHCRRRYGTPFTLRFPENPAIFVTDDPAIVREIFTAPWTEVHAGKSNDPLKPILGEGSMLLLDGERHIRERKLLMPPFHGARMKSYGQVMGELTERELASWPLGEPFAVQPRTQAITLDVILRTVFGMEEGAALDELRDALTALMTHFSRPELMVPFFQRDLGPRSPWGRFLRLKKRTDALLLAQIERRRRAGEGEDILSMLLAARHEDGSAMTDQELRDELITLLLAGHETTATALSWALHHLTMHPEVQRRLHRELDEVLGEGGDGVLELERLSELRYLDAIIQETLRLIPTVPAVGRILSEPRTLGGWEVPAGALVSPSIYLAHHNRSLWEHPDRFEPERFLERRASPFELFPFGGGVRRCIGMAFALYEMRVVLATVLRGHCVRRAPGRVVPRRRTVTIAPSRDMPLVLERR